MRRRIFNRTVILIGREYLRNSYDIFKALNLVSILTELHTENLSINNDSFCIYLLNSDLILEWNDDECIHYTVVLLLRFSMSNLENEDLAILAEADWQRISRAAISTLVAACPSIKHLSFSVFSCFHIVLLLYFQFSTDW